MKTIDLKKIIKTALVLVLIFNFMMALFFSIINPEDYFFGSKFSGKNAMIYLIGNGVIGLLIVYALFRKEKKGI